MGQKIHPKGLRIGIIEGWDSSWYAEGNRYAENVEEDNIIRTYLKKRLYRAGISRIFISRRANQIEVDLHTARPGIIIGKGGKDVALIREELINLVKKQIQLNIHEENNPDSCSQLVAENIALQLEKRVAFRRAMRQATMKSWRT